jgi:integrative and conjugative element protein (TIGR02256 family)
MKLELDPAVRRRMRRHLRSAGSREIGGVLMAEQIATDHFRVIDFSVDDQTGTYAHFVRSPEHHDAALSEFFERTGSDYQRFNYLGEWHSHPSFPVTPSVEDVASMSSLVNGERDIAFAVLLIVKLKMWIKLEYSATLFVRQSQVANNIVV